MGNEAKDDIKGFDLRTHIIDPLTGKLSKYQPYKYVVDREKGAKFYRGDKCYFENGEEDTSYRPSPKPVTPSNVKAGHDQKLS